MIYSPSLLQKVVGESLHYLRWTQSIAPEGFGLSEVWNLQSNVRDPKITASNGECQQTYHLNKPQHISHLPQNTQLPELPQDALAHTHQRKSISVQELRMAKRLCLVT